MHAQGRRDEQPTAGTAPPGVVQRHFVETLHEGDHKHPRVEDNKTEKTSAPYLFVEKSKEYLKEITGLKTVVDGTSDQAELAADRLDTLAKILRSHARAIKDTPRYQSDSNTIDGLAVQATSARHQWIQARDERLARELGDTLVKRALEHLERLERCGADATAHALRAVDAGRDPGSGAAVGKAAGEAAGAVDRAREEHAQLASLLEQAAKSDKLTATVDAYRAAGDRALKLAEQIAGAAAGVTSAREAAAKRTAIARLDLERAQGDERAAALRSSEARLALRRLGRYGNELRVTVGEWRREPDVVPEKLDKILRDHNQRLTAARKERKAAAAALPEKREALRVAQERFAAEDSAADLEALAEIDKQSQIISAGAADQKATAELRATAGGVEAAERMSALVPDGKRLAALVAALGPARTLEWLEAPQIGPARMLDALEALGGPLLDALVLAVPEGKLAGLVSGLSATRLAALLAPTGLGPAKLGELATAGFEPAEIDALAKDLTVPTLLTVLGDVDAEALKTLALPSAKLAALLGHVNSAQLAALITAVGAKRVGDYGKQLSATELPALAVLTPDVLSYLDATAGRLKSLLGSFTAGELNSLNLKDTELKALVTELTAPGVTALATALTYAKLKELVAAMPAKTIRTLVAQVTAANVASLLGSFTPTELTTFYQTVGDPRMRELVVTLTIPAAVLKAHDATWLKNFKGAGAAAWTHVTTAHFSPTTHQISGAHDEDVFLTFIASPSPVAGTANATITSSEPVAPIYKVYYRTYNGHLGSKTLIQDLKTNKTTWMTSFNEAVWDAVRRSALTAGKWSGQDSANQSYEGWFDSGAYQVATIYPL